MLLNWVIIVVLWFLPSDSFANCVDIDNLLYVIWGCFFLGGDFLDQQNKKSIIVGAIGLPNVGKSSLINSLKRCHVVSVGATSGLTRSMQEVQLDKNVQLLDCLGVVMLKSQNDASIAL